MHPKAKFKLVRSLAIISMTLISCLQKPISDEKQRFINYLQMQYQEKPPERKHFYILCNSYLCRGCITKHLSLIDSVASIIPHEITIITTQQFKQLEALEKKLTIKYDYGKTLDREDLNLNNLTVYTTLAGAVVEISHFGINQELQLMETLTAD